MYKFQTGLFIRGVLLFEGLAQGWHVPEFTKGVVDSPEHSASEEMKHNLFRPNVICVGGDAP